MCSRKHSFHHQTFEFHLIPFSQSDHREQELRATLSEKSREKGTDATKSGDQKAWENYEPVVFGSEILN